jgi:outer membrane immunogenic protein
MTKRITSFFALITFVLAASGSAFAADIAVKAPLPAPTPVYSWTGWYVGVNAGASFGHANTDFNVAPVTTTNLTIGGTVTGPGVAVSDTEHPSGFIGGGQIGYNWQYSPLIVMGLEADFQGALERDSNTLSNPFSLSTTVVGGGAAGAGALVTGTVATNYTTQIDWFGTVRGRIGYVWGTNGDVLTYVTGGLAYGEVKINGTNTVSGSLTSGGTLPFSLTQAIGHSQVNTGWVVGWGTEGHLPGNLIPIPGNWTWKIEGLYMDLGTLDATGVTSGASLGLPGFSLTGGQVATHTRFTDGILRAGLNYQFH